MPETLSLTSPTEVVSAIPALLGFHPTDSLVVLCLDPERGRLVCTMRIDLDTPAAEVTRRLIDLAARLGSVTLLTVAYPETLTDWIDSANESAVRTVLDDVQTAGIDLKEALLVTEGRWWSMLCTDPTCCPITGTLIPTETTVLEALRVRQGLPSVATSRDDLRSRYALRPEASPDALEAARKAVADSLGHRCQRAVDLLHKFASGPEEADVVEMMHMLQDVHVRDWVLAELATDPVDPALVDALVQVALSAPEELRPRLAGTAAAALALSGDSPVGVWALVDHAGDDSLAGLVAQGTQACLPPAELRAVFSGARQVIEQRLNDEKTNGCAA